MLVDYFLSQGKHGYLGRGRMMSPEAMQVLMNYQWPGNIGELQNVCERMQILAEGHTIMVGDLPENIRRPEYKVNAEEYDPDVPLHEVEKRHISSKALHYFNGNKTRVLRTAWALRSRPCTNKLHMYGEFENFAVHSKPEPTIGRETSSTNNDSPVM